MGKGQGSCGQWCLGFSLVCTLLVGAALLASGIGIIVVSSNKKRDRAPQINSVQTAVDAWKSDSGPTGWRQLTQLNASAVLRPGPGAGGLGLSGAACPGLTLQLRSEACPLDLYVDETDRFQAVRQLKLCARVDYSSFQQCDYQVELTVQQPGAPNELSLARLPDLVGSGPQRVEIRMGEIGGPRQCSSSGRRLRCFGADFDYCRRECQSAYGGDFTCSGNGYRCSADAFTSGLAVKVAYRPGGSGSPALFALDTASPALAAQPGGGYGANILRQGFSYITPNPQSGVSPRWVYDELRFKSSPAAVSLTIRSSSDPWLAYMAVTGGSGYFGNDKAVLVLLGSTLIALGGAALLGLVLFMACLYWGRSLAERSVDGKPPEGCAARQAWSLSMSCCPTRLHYNNAVAPDPYAHPYPQPQQPQAVLLVPLQQPHPQPAPYYGTGPPPPPPPGTGYSYPPYTVAQQPYAVAQQPYAVAQQPYAVAQQTYDTAQQPYATHGQPGQGPPPQPPAQGIPVYPPHYG